jgi:hypothetical protein
MYQHQNAGTATLFSLVFIVVGFNKDFVNSFCPARDFQ